MMNDSEFLRIKKKMLSLDVKRYWGDDFDVRFYLISQLKQIKEKFVLDVGGGIGIIGSELDQTNTRVNLDLDFKNLKICKDKVDKKIQLICASMLELPFRDQCFDIVICAHVIEVGKQIDLERQDLSFSRNYSKYPTIDKILTEIKQVLKSGGVLYLTTPNNEYYRSIKLEYFELKNALKEYFTNFSLYFFNTYPTLSTRYRKLNLTNVVPKLRAKITKKGKILQSLIKKDSDRVRKSVSFYVEAIRN